MNWFRYVFLALILVCAVSLLSLLAPDSKSSDRRFRIYIASVVAVGARVETVNSYEIVRLNYALPIVGEWSRDQLFFSRQETRIHVPQGSITQGEYDFS